MPRKVREKRRIIVDEEEVDKMLAENKRIADIMVPELMKLTKDFKDSIKQLIKKERNC
jgi:hypothetical protein